MTNTFDWFGASGTPYPYSIYEIEFRPGNKHSGNYIFAKIVGREWHAVYIGQGHLQQRYDAALDEGCVQTKGATHYHVHVNNNEAKRTAEESDLIAGNAECKWPNGCNYHD